MNVGIISSDVIRTARIGVLNAHPGLLPWVRGVDAVASSLLEGVAPGSTVHFVNEGIDTGPIISRHLLPAGPGTDLEELKRGANLQALMALIQVIESIRTDKTLQAQSPSERFALHHRLASEDLKKGELLARAGGAMKLYKRWRREHPELGDGGELVQRYSWILKNRLNP